MAEKITHKDNITGNILTNKINFPSKVWMSHTNSIIFENQKPSYENLENYGLSTLV